jgi:hypothetical protein
MSRKSLDCRQVLANGTCTLVITGSEAEVLDLAILHAIVSHNCDDPYRLRQKLQALLVDLPEVKSALA